jgi:hypothetical protein
MVIPSLSSLILHTLASPFNENVHSGILEGPGQALLQDKPMNRAVVPWNQGSGEAMILGLGAIDQKDGVQDRLGQIVEV